MTSSSTPAREEAKFTKGPWRVFVSDRAPNARPGIEAAGCSIICAGHFGYEHGVQSGNDPRDPEVELANAALIAAAPELYDMVRNHRDTVAYYIKVAAKNGDDEGAKLRGITLAIIDDLLARAEGRS